MPSSSDIVTKILFAAFVNQNYNPVTSVFKSAVLQNKHKQLLPRNSQTTHLKPVPSSFPALRDICLWHYGEFVLCNNQKLWYRALQPLALQVLQRVANALQFSNGWGHVQRMRPSPQISSTFKAIKNKNKWLKYVLL